MSELVNITIDGEEYQVPAGGNLLQTCLDLGLMIPHFCYHEALGPAGACRLCAVMVAPAKDKPARLDMACMTRVSAGMVVSVCDPAAKDFRRGVIEYLMLNHPHDCPVCDEGGECMLQDMTVLSEHSHRRTRFAKRTWRNQYLGPLVHHEMNRCITCYRCVRFYREYALGKDLGAFGSRNRVYFGRPQDGVLESEFAGNLVDVCPTGVFTNKRFREVYARPWDLRTARSVCVHCSVGCNLLLGGRHATLRRVKPAPHEYVNRFFICDRGRYGGEYVNNWPRRVKAVADGEDLPPRVALKRIGERLRSIVEQHGPDSVMVLSSARASLEVTAAAVMLTKALGATPRVVVHDNDGAYEAERLATSIITGRSLPTPSLVDIEKCDVILSVGGDLTGEAPMIDLSVRQAIRAGARLFVISPRAGKLDEFARASMRVRPDAIAQVVGYLAAAMANKSDTLAPDFAEVIQSLGAARRPLILCSALHGDAALVAAARDLAQAVDSPERRCSLGYYFAAANTVGVSLLRESMRPSQAIEEIAGGKVRAVMCIERDAATMFGDADAAKKALAACEYVVALESVDSVLAEAAHAWVPALPPYLTSGKFVNYEGRVQQSQALRLAVPLELGPADALISIVSQLGGDELLQQTQYSDVFAIAADLNGAMDGLEPDPRGLLLQGDSTASLEAAGARPAESRDAWVQWDIVATFGSEELSALAPPIAELAPADIIELHPEDAVALGVRDGDEIASPIDSRRRARLVVNSGLARGTVAMPRLARLASDASPLEVRA